MAGNGLRFGFEMKETATPELQRLLKRAGDLSPGLKKVEDGVLRPLKRRAWSGSGIRSRSGELKESVVTFHGKRSAGISVHTVPGKDLIIPKAHTLTKGAKRHQFRVKKPPLVRAYRRLGRLVAPHRRFMIGTPFGDVKARPFVPKRLEPADERKAAEIIKEHMTDVSNC